jgi:hypothetical protein
MILFRCNNSECPYSPCYLRCDKCGGEQSIDKPNYCPFGWEEDAKWKLLPYTSVTMSTCDQLDTWLDSIRDKLPEHTMDIIDGLFPFDSFLGQNSTKLAQASGLMRDYETSYFERDELIAEIKKMDKLQILATAFHAAFRAGLIYAEMIREQGDDLTRNDEE